MQTEALKKLQKSIKQIFGFEEPGKYLEKFIQFEIKLDCGEVSKEITEKFAEYIAMFDKDIFDFDNSIENDKITYQKMVYI